MSDYKSEQPMSTLGLWAGLLQKPELTGMWYHAKEIKLDGYKFISCRFDKCKLHVTSTNFTLDHCIIDDDTVILYGSEIMKPIQLFNARYDWVYKSAPDFAPKRYPDGTISIGA